MTRLQISYDAELYFENMLDSDIEKTVGKECCGSGMGFGKRDIAFTFRSKKDAEAARKKILSFIKKKKLTKKMKAYIEV